MSEEDATARSADGLGQSALDDLRFMVRFRRLRRTPIAWRRPDAEEASRWTSHPIAGRFGDVALAVATHDGMEIVVLENDWHGWPDPPRFALLAFLHDAPWCASNFDGWPRAWGAEPDGPAPDRPRKE